MGVTGLWKLVEPCGSPVPIDTLEGKTLAVDISIWLHQVVKGYQDSKGSLLPQAHLLGLFHRLCKLLYYRVRPVFVFDGCVPQLKRDTIIRRHYQRSKLNSEAERIQALLLQSLAKEKAVQQALGINTQLLIKSPRMMQSCLNNDKNENDDIFKLPDFPSGSEAEKQNIIDDEINSFNLLESSTSTENSSFDDSNPWREYNTNLQTIDVRSEHFKSLPAEVRHEILVDIKETRKQSSWGRLHELPSCSDDFSSFQMKRLLKRRAVQESLEETEKEMGEKALTYTDLQNFFAEEGLLEDRVNQDIKSVCSDDAIRFTLVRDLKKSAQNETKTNENDVSWTNKLVEEMTKSQIVRKEKEYSTDLEIAIALSMEDDSTHVYSKVDYEYESNENLKLNRHQRRQLKNAAIGPARAYMVEYGGMNFEEVEKIMEKTQLELSTTKAEDDIASDMRSEKENPKRNECLEVEENIETVEVSQDICLRVSDDSETDSDLEEVVNTNDPPSRVKPMKNFEITINTQDPKGLESDIFSDIFEYEKTVLSNPKHSFGDNTILSNSSKNESVEECGIEQQTYKTKPAIFDNVIQGDITKTEAHIESVNGDKITISSILDDLKKQADDIKNINLDNINIGKSSGNYETIEIYDSDDQKLDPLIKPSESHKFRTSSKKKGINNYFETKYLIKRTPERSVQEEKLSPGVKSPFFVKKSPLSHQKDSKAKISKSSGDRQKLSKASKKLFGDNRSTELSKGDSTELQSEDLLEKTARDLSQQKTTEQLQLMATDLENDRRNLETERNRQDRMAATINQNMHTDCQNLLKLFGIPYIIAPMEAEAQCAFLELSNLTDGTITDDSDIWLFGGRTVYKNFFEQNKHVLKFEADKIKQSFNCDRAKLIQLACLVGSDYTTGIHGIGTVTALEILAMFSKTPKGVEETSNNYNTTTATVISALCRFRDWLKTYKDLAQPTGNSALNLRKKLKNIELNDGFPNPAVVEAYLYPKVDSSEVPFSWGYPEVNAIHALTEKLFGWTKSKTDDLLKPVLKRINHKQTQTSLHNYFTIKSTSKSRELKVSKRVQKAIDAMAGKLEKDERVVAKNGKGVRSHVNKQKEDSTYDLGNIPSTSTAISTGEVNVSIPRIPSNKEVTPQREKDKEKMRHNTKKEATLLRKTIGGTSTSKSLKKRRKI